KTKECAIKIKKFEKSDEFDLKKAFIIGKVSVSKTDVEVEKLTNTFSELKICQVDQSKKGTNRIDKLESNIVELTKVIKNMADNKNQSNK
ncbi:28408_t:CDS:1, partial [Dentiscutata erythropus]